MYFPNFYVMNVCLLLGSLHVVSKRCSIVICRKSFQKKSSDFSADFTTKNEILNQICNFLLLKFLQIGPCEDTP